MKNISRLLGLVLSISMVIGCQENNQLNEQTKVSDAELETEIKMQIDSFYKVYLRYNTDWIDFFEDEFTNVFIDTPIRKTSKDSTKALWTRIYKKYDVQLLERGSPSFILSDDMVISHNSFNEIFINKQTNDTIKSPGTYIVAWRKQLDGSWKIAFESVQAN